MKSTLSPFLLVATGFSSNKIYALVFDVSLGSIGVDAVSNFDIICQNL